MQDKPIKLNVTMPVAFRDLWTPSRYKIYHGGRGGAKSWAFASALLAIGASRKVRVLCARELQKSVKDSVHRLLSDIIAADPILAGLYEVQQTAIIGRNGTNFAFCGLRHNAAEIKSYEGVDYCWVEEAQSVSDASWEILIPTIRQHKSEIWLSFNPRSPTDPTWQKFIVNPRPDSIIRKVNYDDNPFFPDVLDAERRHCEATDPEAYQHIWLGGFDTRYSGSVYARWVQDALDDGRTCQLDPALPVHTAWDLGFDDATAIVFWQRTGSECRIVDAYEASGEDICHYCDVLDARGYGYGNHYVPHDAANKLLAAGGRSIVQQMHERGYKSRVVAATSQQNQIEALRAVLGKTWWCQDKCKDLIHAAMSYHFDYDEERKVFKTHPEHDFSSHYCDALEIIGQVWQKEKAQVEKTIARFVNHQTADELFWGDEGKKQWKRI